MNRDKLIESLRKAEGTRLRPYHDAKGKLTIGVGHNLTDNGISTRVAEILLDEDIDAALDKAHTFSWFAGLDDVRQRVVVELVFNMGLAGFSTFKRMIAAIADARWTTAGRELLESQWVGEVGRMRADRLATMLITGQEV